MELLVKTDCPGTATVNSASVSSGVGDPNLANNSVANVASDPC